MDETFNAATTSANSDATDVQGHEKVMFFVDYDETETEGGISAAIRIQVSYDGTTYMNAPFYDYDGGTTPQVAETIQSDANYYCWLDDDLRPPYIRLRLITSNTDADDTLDIEAYIATTE
jgi:hypothetical protein